MPKLITLANIPYSARKGEATARRKYSSRQVALNAAQWSMAVAPGCHSRSYWDPPMIGWVLTKDAAEALANVSTHMPGGTSHHRAVIWDRPDQ